MSAIMQQLKADHGNISRLLATLEEQMDVVVGLFVLLEAGVVNT